MKITSYIITILLFSFTTAANKSITELGSVKIEDLFYNSESPLSATGIENIGRNPIDKILVKNEDLELESLEIADIDLATFGEYEDFLNKYYDDNFNDINSRFIRQFKVFTGGSFGTKIPFGQNAKTNMKDGIKFGINFKDIYSYDFLGRETSVNLDFGLTINDHIISNDKNWKILYLDTFLETKLINNLKTQTGVGLMSVQFQEPDSNNKSLGYSLFFGLNYDFKILNYTTITLFSRAQLEKTIISNNNDDLYNNNASIETLIFGISSSIPFYIQY